MFQKMAWFSSVFLKMFNETRRYHKIFGIYRFEGTLEESRVPKTKVKETLSVKIPDFFFR